MANLYQPVPGFRQTFPDTFGSLEAGYEKGKGFAEEYHAKKDEARAEELANKFRSAIIKGALGQDTPQATAPTETAATMKATEKPAMPKLSESLNGEATQEATAPTNFYAHSGGPVAEAPKGEGMNKAGAATGAGAGISKLLPSAPAADGMDGDFAPNSLIPVKSHDTAKDKDMAEAGLNAFQRAVRENPNDLLEYINLRGGKPEDAIAELLGITTGIQNQRNSIADANADRRIKDSQANIYQRTDRTAQAEEDDARAKDEYIMGIFDRLGIDEINRRQAAGETITQIALSEARATGQVVPKQIMQEAVKEMQQRVDAENAAKAEENAYLRKQAFELLNHENEGEITGRIARLNALYDFELGEDAADSASVRKQNEYRANRQVDFDFEQKRAKAEAAANGNNGEVVQEMEDGEQVVRSYAPLPDSDGQQLYGDGSGNGLYSLISGDSGWGGNKQLKSFYDQRENFDRTMNEVQGAREALLAINHFVSDEGGENFHRTMAILKNKGLDKSAEWLQYQKENLEIGPRGHTTYQSIRGLVDKIRLDLSNGLNAHYNSVMNVGSGGGLSRQNNTKLIYTVLGDTKTGVVDETSGIILQFLDGGIDMSQIGSIEQSIGGMEEKLGEGKFTAQTNLIFGLSHSVAELGVIRKADANGNPVLDAEGNPVYATAAELARAIPQYLPKSISEVTDQYAGMPRRGVNGGTGGGFESLVDDAVGQEAGWTPTPEGTVH